jgi:serine protease AprX
MSEIRIVKVFADQSQQESLANEYELVEHYESFVVLKIPASEVGRIAAVQLVEDITDEYVIKINGTDLRSSTGSSVSSGGRPSKAVVGAATGQIAIPSAGPHHYLVQFVGPIKEEWLAAVAKKGGKIREPLNGFVYIVRATEVVVARIQKLPCVRWIGHYRHSDRIASSVTQSLMTGTSDECAKLPRRRTLANVLSVAFFGTAEARAASGVIEELGVELLAEDLKAALLTIRVKGTAKQRAKQVAAIAAVHGVRRIRESSVRRTCNDVSAGIMGTVNSLGSSGLHLSGDGEIIGVCDTGLDTGDIATIHEDFAGRIIALKSYPLARRVSVFVHNPQADDGPADVDSGHGTHVVGSILGSGAAARKVAGAPEIRGLAYNASLVFQAVEQETKWKSFVDQQKHGRFGLQGLPDDLKSLFLFAYEKGARIHSNSWGGGDAGAYDNSCRQVDEFIWDHKDFCILFAAGNDGTDSDGSGVINPGSVSSPGTAKNCITVGACEGNRPGFTLTYGQLNPRRFPVPPISNDPMANNPDQIAAFSSRGPTLDDRTKPDVVAPGTFILSTRSTQIGSNNFAWGAFPASKKYFHMGGTSMATPLVAGAVGLIREFLRKKVGIAKPTAALLKGALIAGARRLPMAGVAGQVSDNNQGFGRVHLDAILSPPSPAKAAFIEIAPGLTTGSSWLKEFKIVKPAGLFRVVLTYTDYPGSNLVNNLNLIVTSPTGTKYLGNQSAGGIAVFDKKNNVEVVHEDSAVVGNWKVQVVASSVPVGPQDFAVVVLGNIA